MNKLKIVIILSLCCQVILTADAKRLDAWFEPQDIFGISSGGKSELVGAAKDITLDHSSFKNGDYSIMYKSNGAGFVGFKPAKFLPPWQLSKGTVLNFHARAQRKTEVDNGIAMFVDKSGNSAAVPFKGLDKNGDWQKFQIRCADIKSDDGKFDIGAVAAVKFRVSLQKGDTLWFDDVHFIHPDGSIVGVTDKSVQQRMNEAAQTKLPRAEAALAVVQKKCPESLLNDRYAKLYFGVELDEVNAELLDILTTTDVKIRAKYNFDDKWTLFLNSMLHKLYFNFGSKGKLFPGRLYPETEKALLEVIWERMAEKNDIHLARQSTWWMTGSENHDMVAKASAILASRIFSEHPDYAGRALPNKGTGGGSGYWFHKSEETGHIHGPDGRANLGDGKLYYSKDHYNEWVRFFKEYFKERAYRGFFLEYGSPTYIKYTLSYTNDIYDFCDDPELKAVIGKFFDVFWCDWAQDQIDGIRGGAKTREHGYTTGTVDSTYNMATAYFGGDGDPIANYGQLFSDYNLPEIAWKMALDRQGMGEFAYASRKIGEEQDLWPRPLGNERTLICDTDSRFIRYSWVTPHYIMGTQMDHPAAVHSHLSVASRWHGVTFATSPAARVFPRAIEDAGDNKWKVFKQSGMYRSVQDKNVLITQQSRGYRWVSPEWFPHTDQFSQPYGIFFGKALDTLEEKNGWIFVHEGQAYLAVRVVLGEYFSDNVGSDAWLKHQAKESIYSELLEESYSWSSDKTIAVLKEKYSPMIFEVATVNDYKTFDEFKTAILEKSKITLQKTVVPGWYVLMYKGAAPDAQEIYFNSANNEMPMVAGEYINYSSPKLFDSPYLQSDYKSGVIKASFTGEQMTWDFRD